MRTSDAYIFPNLLFGPPRFIEPVIGWLLGLSVESKVGNISAPTQIPPFVLYPPGTVVRVVPINGEIYPVVPAGFDTTTLP